MSDLLLHLVGVLYRTALRSNVLSTFEEFIQIEGIRCLDHLVSGCVIGLGGVLLSLDSPLVIVGLVEISGGLAVVHLRVQTGVCGVLRRGRRCEGVLTSLGGEVAVSLLSHGLVGDRLTGLLIVPLAVKSGILLVIPG